MSLRKRLLALGVVAVTVVSVMLVSNVFATVPTATSTYYLHGTTSLTLNTTAPTLTTANYKDAPALTRTTYKDVGTWTGTAGVSVTTLFRSLSPLTVWLGLVNSDDQGTWFDVQAQVLLNGTTVIANGSKTNIQNVTRDATKALQISVPLTLISNPPMINPGNTLSLKISAKVTATGGHASAVGLRVYYDANNRAANFGLTTQAAIMDLQVGATNPTTATFSIGNIKPTSTGNAANWLVKNVGSLDGTLSIKIDTITNNENGITEPEASAGDVTPAVGELGAKLKVAVWMDVDKNGGWSSGDYYLASSGSKVSWVSGSTLPAAAYDFLNNYAGKTWANLQTVLAPTDAGNFRIEYNFPNGGNSDNVALSDSCVFNIIFTLSQ